MIRANSPELLAPAGDWDALRAAVANGADAVYFGLDRFNARHRATNFTQDELPEVIRYLHDRNVKGFVTFNTLIFSDELADAAEYLCEIASAGVDAVIVQDFGVARLIHRLAPDLPIHASTQMTLTEPRGVEFAREHLHIARAVLARELSAREIRRVAEATTVPLEVFIHGALCVAYSGQCLTSESLGGRSANRGQCAQACRLPYRMIVDGEERDLGDRAYLLSPQDLAAHEWVGELVDSGVASFKIEGRLKSSHYVAAATQTYREAIDARLAERDFAIGARQAQNLSLTYSRGFIPGFLEGVNHQRTVQGRVPKARGLRAGRVLKVGRQGIALQLEVGVHMKAGDGVVFDLGTPAEQEPGGRIWSVEAIGGSRVSVHFDAAFDTTSIPEGCTVWKTDDPALRRELEQTYAGDPIFHRTPIRVRASGRPGSPLVVQVSTAGGLQTEVQWPGPLQAALKHPFTAERLDEQFDRLGDTPFALESATADFPEPVLVPKSVLNELRRQAVAALRAAREAGEPKPIAERDALEAMRREVRAGIVPASEPSAARLTVLARTREQLRTILDHAPAVELVYCDFEDVRHYGEAVALARERKIPIGLAALRIVKPGEEGFLSPILKAEPDAVLIRNLASLLYFKEKLPGARLIGDFALNVANELTAQLFLRQGLERLVPSYDLNWDQFEGLMRRSDPARFEAVIHQRMPMFHMEHCVFAAFLSDGKDFRDCGRPCDRHRVELKDRAGAEFPVIPDAGCRNTVYNSLPQTAVEYVPRMLELGVRHFRIDLLRESADEVSELLSTYGQVISGRQGGRGSWNRLRAMNQLGVTRGTLKLL